MNCFWVSEKKPLPSKQALGQSTGSHSREELEIDPHTASQNSPSPGRGFGESLQDSFPGGQRADVGREKLYSSFHYKA